MNEETTETPRDTFDDVHEPTPKEIEARKAEQERQNQIGAAHVILNQTDFKLLKALESILAAETATQVLANIKAVAGDLEDVLKLRKEQREVINKLE